MQFILIFYATKAFLAIASLIAVAIATHKILSSSTKVIDAEYTVCSDEKPSKPHLPIDNQK